MRTDSQNDGHIDQHHIDQNHSGAHSNNDWVAQAASEAYRDILGAGRVASHFGTGVLHEVELHPGQFATEVVSGAAIAATVTALGLSTMTVGAIAAVPLAAYGIYEAGKIAATEGVGAIPRHIAEAAHQAEQAMSHTAQAAGTLYHGNASPLAMRDAEHTIEAVGRDATPYMAAAAGGIVAAEATPAAVRAIGARTPLFPGQSELPRLTIVHGRGPALLAAAVTSNAGAGDSHNRPHNSQFDLLGQLNERFAAAAVADARLRVAAARSKMAADNALIQEYDRSHNNH